MQRTIDFEIDRQIKVLEAGGTIVQETRHWNEDTGTTTSMRTKEESEDYRYFQDPDLLPLEVTEDWQEEIGATIARTPRTSGDAATWMRVSTRSLQESSSTTRELGSLFDEAVAAGTSGRAVGIWLTGEVVAFTRRNEVSVAETPLTAAHLTELTAMVDDGKLSSSAAKEVLIAVLGGEGRPGDIAEAKDLLQVSDTGAIEAAVDQVLSENADAVDKIKAGDMKPLRLPHGAGHASDGRQSRSQGRAGDAQVTRHRDRR